MSAERDEAAGTNQDQSRLPAGTDAPDPQAETGEAPRWVTISHVEPMTHTPFGDLAALLAPPPMEPEELVELERRVLEELKAAPLPLVVLEPERYETVWAATSWHCRVCWETVPRDQHPDTCAGEPFQVEVIARRPVRQRQQTDDELHQYRRHPDWEYATTRGPRKAFDNQPPDGDGWEPNITRADPEAWERFDYHEEAHWRRRRTPARYAATSDTPERGGPR